MQTAVCCGLVGPDSFVDENTGSATPDPETLRIMLAHDPSAELKFAGPSSWDLMTSEERKAMKERRYESQRQPFIPPGGPAPPYAERREPISGALYEERRVYTRNEREEWRFWGTMEDGMSEEEFWAIHDPLHSRENEATQVPTTEPRRTPHHQATSEAKASRSKNNAQAVASHRVRKSQTPSSSSRGRPRRSLGSTKDKTSLAATEEARNHAISISKGNQDSRSTPPKLAGKSQEENDTGRSNGVNPGPVKAVRGRPRKGNSVSRASRALARAQAENPDSFPKRPRGRPPKQTAGRSAKETDNRQPPAMSTRDARVTKPRKAPKPLCAPSIHHMRTRARGSAERSQLS